MGRLTQGERGMGWGGGVADHLALKDGIQ